MNWSVEGLREQREQREHEITQKYRAQFAQGRTRAMMAATPSALASNPAEAGRLAIELLDAKAEFEARALGDTYLSPEARKAIAAALLEEVRIGLGQIAERARAGLDAKRAALQPPAAAPLDPLARQVELQRAESRLTVLVDRALQPMDIIHRSDSAMLDALELAPDVYLGVGAMPDHMLAEAITARRYEVADSATRAYFDRRAQLDRQQHRFDALLAAADYEAEHSLGDSGIRPASVWVAPAK